MDERTFEYRLGYIEIVCPSGESYDALIQATQGTYTCRSSCYGDLTIRIYFQQWVEVQEVARNG